LATIQAKVQVRCLALNLHVVVAAQIVISQQKGTAGGYHETKKQSGESCKL
jgi:hypothetical protein